MASIGQRASRSGQRVGSSDAQPGGGSPHVHSDQPAARAASQPEPVRVEAWATIRQRLRAKGLRWTPQRRLLVEVLEGTRGHVTGAALVERCRSMDPGTTPSTVYRTLDVLEELGLLRHCHGADGREEFHVLPQSEHGHLYCSRCGGNWDIAPEEGHDLVAGLERRRGFRVDLSHVTIVGLCETCRDGQGGRPL